LISRCEGKPSQQSSVPEQQQPNERWNSYEECQHEHSSVAAIENTNTKFTLKKILKLI